MDSLLDTLNPPQRQAVEHGDGPLLILAGAGSGKTRVLTHRIAYLLRQGVSPFHLLAITFTNKAAREMQERVEQLVGAVAKSIWVSTFHSACVRILRRDIEKLGYDRRFVILDTSDQTAVIKDCLKTLNVDEKQFAASAVLGAISAAKNELIDAEAYERRAADYFTRHVAQVYTLYQDKLRRNNALDFDDLIMLTVRLFEAVPPVLEYYQERFRYILVDEYQDTNHAQYLLVRLLAARWRNLAVVGDDDQGIYSWRGANIRNILEFEKDYPDARVIKLEQNYRSTQNILTAAHAVVTHNLGRKDKKLWTAMGPGEPIVRYQASSEYDEAYFVANVVADGVARGLHYADYAVLYRTHAASRVFEEVFNRQGIPYGIVGGLKFWERKEVKDILAYLRLVANPADLVALRRAIGAPKRGIGPASVDRIEEYAAQRNLPIGQAAAAAHDIPGLGKAMAEKVAGFAALIDGLRQQAEFLTVAELVQQVYERSGYLTELRAERSLEAMGREENLKELANVAATHVGVVDPDDPEATALDTFLANAALQSDQDTLKEDQDQVVMMTLHTAKGLEFPVVFLVALEEGVFPHSRAMTDERELEEERRLCYVGMTRARRRLYLTNAWSRTQWGQSNFNSPSRFLEEVPEALVEMAQGGTAAASFPYRGQAGLGFGERGGGRRPLTPAPDPFGSPPRPARAFGGPAARPVRSAPDDDDFGPAIGAPGWGKSQKPQPEPAASAPPSVAFVQGDRVRHVKFGEGQVVRVHGDEVTVQFATVGEKTLIAHYLQPA